jgi:phage tail sheath gpL-like
MSIAFNNLSANIRTSLFFAEFNSGVPPYSGSSAQIVIGHKTALGTAVNGILVPYGDSDPNILFGAGSILADMVQFARWHDPVGAIYVLPVAEPGSAVARVDTITFTGPATASGNFVRYIAGERVSIPVAAGDTATQIATRLAAAINAGYVRFNRRMLWTVTATSSAGVVTLTANHGGVVGNQVRIDSGLEGNEVDPAGITVAVANTTAGAGDVDIAAALAYLNSNGGPWITSAFAPTATILNATQTFLSDAGSGGWSPTVQKRAHYTTALSGSLGSLTAFGVARNDPHATVLGVQNYPHPLWCISAALNGVVARSKNIGASITEAIEISRPLQTIVLQGIRPPKSDVDRWSRPDREALYNNGIAACYVDAANVVRVERTVTTFQRNAWGSADATWLDLETLAQSMYIGAYLRQRIETTFPRCALMNDNPLNLQGVVTPESALNVGRHAWQELCDGGIGEKPDLVKKYMKCERSGDANRLNFFLPADVVNQLRVFAANITVYTEFDPNRQVA